MMNLEIVANHQAQHWRLSRPQTGLHFDKGVAFLCTQENIKAGLIREIAETGSAAAGALMNEV